MIGGWGARDRGTTIVELVVAFAIVGVALMVMLSQISISFRENALSEDRAFAYRKAMAMLAEIQTGVERGSIADAETLDVLADVGGYNARLTTVADENGLPLAPDHPMSGNVRESGEWVWSRVLDVDPIELQEDLRAIRVSVYRRRGRVAWELMATVGGLVTLPARAFQSGKHYDVFVLAIAEAPSLWLPLPAARTLIENARIELQTIENGLKLRLHWITELGYGRDRLYTPFVNVEDPALAASPSVYWYPGLLEEESLFSADYFSGRIRTEEGVLNDYDPDGDPYPHAIADRWNHCMREPAARALFEQRVAAGLEDPGEQPLQLLLEDLWRHPERYQNAIFVNLHGPALPLPPLRNYADAAKDPAGRPGVRVVTHPERLWTPRADYDAYASERPAFRVYAYKTDPEAGDAVLADPITVEIPGVDLSTDVNGAADGTLQIRRLPGGVSPSTGLAAGLGREYSDLEPAPARASASRPFEMSWEAGFSSSPRPHTWIKLYNTPLVAPPVGGAGLDRDQRLYGMEYVPSPVDRGPGFAVDLADVGSGPKNTARWQIVLPQRLLDPWYGGGYGGNRDRPVEVVTRIGDDPSTGVAWPTPHQPHNRSTTWTWWCASREAVPITERYQMQGDPRHYPYADGVAGGDGFPHGYNWHFDDLREPLLDASSQWPCLDPARLEDGFGAGVLADAPRLLQVLRAGLQRSGVIFANPVGPVAQALLLGGEVALPAAVPGGSPTPVALPGGVFGHADPVVVDSVSPSLGAGSGLQGCQVVVGAGARPFWAREWLGELCPDESWPEWLSRGNLPAGSLPGQFHREPRSDAVLPHLPPGTDFGFGAGAMAGPAGGVALVDTGTLADTFVHREDPPDAAATVTEEANAIALATGDSLPESFPSGWPFGIARAFPGPLSYFEHDLDYPKSLAQVVEQHYVAYDGLTAAGALAVAPRAGAPAMFLSISGWTPTTPEQHGAAAMGSLMTALRTFHRAGEDGVPGRITQVPLLEILEPAEGGVVRDPGSVLLRWKTSFTRFDGQPYTDGYPAGFGEPEEDLVYSILYSRDDGETWRRALDSEPAEPGVRPPDDLLLPDNGEGNESFLLPTPEGDFVGADYVFRIECHHRVRRSHVSQHQVRVTITR